MVPLVRLHNIGHLFLWLLQPEKETKPGRPRSSKSRKAILDSTRESLKRLRIKNKHVKSPQMRALLFLESIIKSPMHLSDLALQKI